MDKQLNQVNIYRRIIYATLHLQSLYSHELSKNSIIRLEEKKAVNSIKRFADSMLTNTNRINKGKPNYEKHAQVIDELSYFLNDIIAYASTTPDNEKCRERILKKFIHLVDEESKRIK